MLKLSSYTIQQQKQKSLSWICFQCRAHSSVVSRAQSSLSPSRRTPQGNSSLVPDTPARTRFAPSPTGFLHLGSLRTALFNYLLAKRTGGQFLLRLEDTDQKRTIPGAEERLYSDLEWAGLHWDEGPSVGGPYGPYRQSERTALYHKHGNDLVRSGQAYRCFCSMERLDSLARQRNEAGLPLGYDRQCLTLSAAEAEERAARGESHVVRLKADGYPMFTDLVFGKTGQNQNARARHWQASKPVFDDPILLKSDGNPTYHLANVVDDHHMKITHVIRGTEWLASTPMHVALYNAFDWTPPKFAHVPLLVDGDGQKLSKRDLKVDISFHRHNGILPAALLNYAALLGWSHNQKSDVFTLEEMEALFTLKITKGNTMVSPAKLWFFQRSHVRKCVAENNSTFHKMVDEITGLVEEMGNFRDKSMIKPAVASLIGDGNFTTTAQFLKRNWPIFAKSIERPPYVPTKADQEPEEIDLLASTLQRLTKTLIFLPQQQWETNILREKLVAIIPDPSTSKELFHYLRWALTGGVPGPKMPQILEALGKDETIRRMKEAAQLTGLEPSRTSDHDED